MSKDTSVKFKSSLSGYNRKNVNEYILQLNNTFTEKEEKLTLDLASAEKKLAQFKAELEAKIAALEAEKASADGIIAQQKELIDSITGENTVLKEENAQMKAELAEIEKRLDEELPPVPDTEKTEANGNVGFYDKMTSQIGTLMINANTAAESIKENAQMEANIIRDRAISEAENIKNEMYRKARIALDDLSQDIKLALEDSLNEALSSISEIRADTDDLLRRIRTRNSEINHKIDYFSSASAEDIRSKISLLSLRLDK